jgi:signal transduction histidine kinase
VIETSLYVLKGRAGEDERTQKHLDRIGQQVTRANDIITQLLSLIRDRPLERRAVDLAALAREAFQEAPRVTLRLGEPDGAWVIEGDATQLHQVLVNLVDNAQAFVAEQGRIEVSLERAGEVVVLRVDDDGPGLDPSVRNRLFEPLVTTRPSGIGLGLALVKRVVERHGGAVTAGRSPLGGARFELTFPARRPR